MHDWLKKNKKKVLAVVGTFLMVSFLVPTMFNNTSGRNGPGAQIGTIGKTVLYEKDRHHAERMWKVIDGCYIDKVYKADSENIARQLEDVAKVAAFKKTQNFEAMSTQDIFGAIHNSSLTAPQIQLLFPFSTPSASTDRDEVLRDNLTSIFRQGRDGEKMLKFVLNLPTDPKRFERPAMRISPIYELGDRAFVTQLTTQIKEHPEFYDLLVKEAEKRGIVITADRIQTAVTNEIKWDFQKLGQLDTTSYSEAVHDFLMVQALFEQVRGDVKFTKAQWDQYFVQTYRAERINRVEYVVDEFDPAHPMMPPSLMHPATQPTAAEQDLYKQFKDVDPLTVTASDKNVLGFGYYVPARVKLQCLEVSRKDVVENLRKRIGEGKSRPPLPPGTDIMGPYKEIIRQSELLLVKMAWDEYFKNKDANNGAGTRDFQSWKKVVMDKEQAADDLWNSYIERREGSTEVLEPWNKFDKEEIESKEALDSFVDPSKAARHGGPANRPRPFPLKLPPGHPTIPSSAAPIAPPAAQPTKTAKADSHSKTLSAAAEQLTRPLMLSAEIGQAGNNTLAFAAATQPTTPPATSPAAAPDPVRPATEPAAQVPASAATTAPSTTGAALVDPTTVAATTEPTESSVKQDEDDKIFKENNEQIVSKGLKSEIDMLTADIAEAIRRKMLTNWSAESEHNAAYPDEVAKSIQGEYGILPTFTQDPRWYRVDQLSTLTPEATLPPEPTPPAPDHPLPAGLGGPALQKAVEDAAPFAKEPKTDASQGLHVWQPGEVIVDTDGNAYVFRLTEASPAHSKDIKDPNVIAQVKEDARIQAAYEKALKDADALVKRVAAGKTFFAAAMVDGKTPIDPADPQGPFNASTAKDHHITPELLAEAEKLVAEADAHPNNPNPIGVLPVPALRKVAKYGTLPKVVVVQLVDVSLQVPKSVEIPGPGAEAEPVPVPPTITTVDQLRAWLKPSIERAEETKAASAILKSYFTMDAVTKRLGYVPDKGKNGS